MKSICIFRACVALTLTTAVVACSESSDPVASANGGRGGSGNTGASAAQAGASELGGTAGTSKAGSAGASGANPAAAGHSANGGNGGASDGGASDGGASDGGASGGCSEGATMPRDCNTCECHSGVWLCTERACSAACGGRSIHSCSANEYCAYQAGQLCGAADASSTCMPRPSDCPDLSKPTCGCDRQTYASPCDAAQHGQGVYADGACEQ